MEAETLERPLATEQSATAIALPPETRAVIARVLSGAANKKPP